MSTTAERYSLIIKAPDVPMAFEYCRENMIDPLDGRRTSFDEVVVHARTSVTRLQGWFNDAGESVPGRGFDYGTLLSFSVD